MRKQKWMLLLLVVMMFTALAQSAAAFSDSANHSQANKMNELQKRGVLSGYENDKFFPDKELTYPEGITMLVKGFNLNINHIRFIKAPEVTDTFPELINDAWYADAFIKAHYNGLDIPKDVKATDRMSREEFAHLLMQAVKKQGDFPIIEIFLLIEDQNEINEAYSTNIQTVLITKLMDLQHNKFFPKEIITRGDAAGALYNGIEFAKTIKEQENTSVLQDVTISEDMINADIKKVTIKATAPHPGYGMKINSISFDGNKAIINIATLPPDPDKVYPQVITDITISTYISAEYTAELASEQSSDNIASSADSAASHLVQ